MAKKKTSRKSTKKATKKKTTRRKPKATARSKRAAAPKVAQPDTQHAGADDVHLNGAQRPCELSQARLQQARDRGSDGNVPTERKGEAYFHKGLSHNIEGSVDSAQWLEFSSSLLELDETGNPTRLADIPFEADNRKWVNPLLVGRSTLRKATLVFTESQLRRSSIRKRRPPKQSNFIGWLRQPKRYLTPFIQHHPNPRVNMASRLCRSR